MTLMRAAIMNGFGQPLRLVELPVPAAGPGEILIRLEASGVCHSDVHIWKGETRPGIDPDPFILGHEGVGEVAALGEGVEGWAVGERAGAAWLHDTCGTCDLCLAGEESFCAAQRAHGFNVPGTFAEYVVAKAAFAVKVPAGDGPALAPLMCAGLTAYGAIERAKLAHGETCAIFGCGGLGMFAVQLAARKGATVIAVDSDPAKLEIARQMGASATELAVPGLAEAWPSSQRAHATINFAPTTRTWPAMLAATRPLGRIVAAAMVAEPVPLSQEWLTWTGITLTGTSVGTRRQMAALMQLHVDAPLQSAVEVIRLQDASDALMALDQGCAKARFSIAF
ncbi:MAG: Zinc-binding alcohol dehydrogenase [Cypionkella sp.]|uniref:alcohol dehydrogenase catalytic domain-containing protein n=1 Tax=Cypionkella sp. TaxID=2811411 RepID=UPI002630D686|nr:alcohol dehydrogenase catalytic domain-containing protein [Cypionkella sp.]MDB5658605.1 Zinc-binding alcohol dehydrogenase [Cypionkella sp.]